MEITEADKEQWISMGIDPKRAIVSDRSRTEGEGNEYYNRMIKESYDQYRGSKANKMRVTKEFVTKVKEEGGGFVKNPKDGSGWVELTDGKARDKVSHAFRRQIKISNNVAAENLQNNEQTENDRTGTDITPSSQVSVISDLTDQVSVGSVKNNNQPTKRPESSAPSKIFKRRRDTEVQNSQVEKVNNNEQTDKNRTGTVVTKSSKESAGSNLKDNLPIKKRPLRETGNSPPAKRFKRRRDGQLRNPEAEKVKNNEQTDKDRTGTVVTTSSKESAGSNLKGNLPIKKRPPRETGNPPPRKQWQARLAEEEAKSEIASKGPTR